MNITDMAQEWLEGQTFRVGEEWKRKKYQETINEATRVLIRANRKAKKGGGK